MKRALIIISALLSAMAPAIAAQEADYTQGIIWVNEDWYGHQNSTVNYLLPDDPDGVFWKYRIIQAENPGMELGCTNQYGALWHDRLYLIAKQEKDPGASITGGRITVADAKTMKILHQQSLIDPSGAQCDGRGFLGVDEHKGYISTSNGVWIFDLDNYTVTGQVEGSANPNAGGDNDKPNTDPTGSLYHGQSGMMVSAAGKVFVAHQQYGLLVVDPTEDKVVKAISMDIVQEGAGIGSIVKSKDGYLWLSIAKNLQGTGATLNYIVRLDPSTLTYEIIEIPEEMYPPSNSWYAWTPDAFVASTVQNCLYWKGGPNRWFTGTKIYKFDCDTREQSLFIDLEEEGANWKLYGCAIGVHPVTDEIYMALYHEFGTPTYITRRYSPQGEKIRDYEMIMNYWFPSLPLFPQSSELSGIEAISEVSVSSAGTLYNLNGLIIKESVDYGEWSGVPAGMYVWKSGDRSVKILIR
ncbi:MAG: DUF5074 domain-containing protein [Bacteroides sp.]|nr:DUF5074 domain-containing protein [Bacteroides sp.]MBD5338961.1 DUF5074 domain-containing protein [Bacteroides sp.]